MLSPAGEPVKNAVVKAARGPFSNPQVQIGDVTTRTQTGDGGSYRLHLEPGKYDVQVSVPGMGAARHQEVEFGSKEKKTLDIQLGKGVTFQALVRDSVTNDPVEGIVLWSWRHPDVEGTSDENGLLEIKGMMEGEFEFNISAVNTDRRQSSVAGNYARWWSPEAKLEHQREETNDDQQLQRNFDDLAFELQGNTYRVNLFVEPLVMIKGQVLDPHGNPVAGATVAPAKTGSGNSITGDTRYSYETDAEGRFTMKLPASKNAKYNLVAHDGKYQQWRSWANGVGEPLQSIPGQTIEAVELRLTHPAAVYGQVTNSLGTPRPGIKVRAAAVDKLDNRYYLPETETDAAGNYELRFIRPGKHRIQIQPFWLDADEAEGLTTQIVELDAGGVSEDVDFKVD